MLDPKFVEAFNFYTGLAKNKVGITPSEISQGWTGGCLQTGKVGVALEGGWIVNSLRDNAPNLKYGTALMPKAPKTGKRGNFLYTVGWAINAGTKNKAAAIKVLNILTSPQVQQYVLEQGLAIPSRTSLQNNAYFSKTEAGAMNAKLVFAGASDGNVRAYYLRPQRRGLGQADRLGPGRRAERAKEQRRRPQAGPAGHERPAKPLTLR